MGERIREWNLERRLFQRDLAKIVGVNEITIFNWETGRIKPTEKNILRIKDILGFEPPTC